MVLKSFCSDWASVLCFKLYFRRNNLSPILEWLSSPEDVCLDEQRARVKGSGVVTGSSIIMVALKDLSGVCKQRAVNCERRNCLNRQG